MKESERTVMTLHYLGEMTCEEISKFLGVSAGTIKSRLQRARNRLQKEEHMIREALEHFQISPNLSDNIMQDISRLKPTPSASKPLMPWVLGAASAVMILLMLGIGSQHLLRFQQPYSLDVQTETTVELIDAPIVLNLDSKPDVQRQLGNTNVLGKSDNNGPKPDEVLLAAAQVDGDDVSVSKQQWVQSEPIRGSDVDSLFRTPEGDIYTVSNDHIYKLKSDGKTWEHIFNTNTLHSNGSGLEMAKWNNTLYFFRSDKLFASQDDGKTWVLVHTWSKKHFFPVGLILTEQAFYLGFNTAIYRSEDTGRTWKAVQDGLGFIRSIVAVQDTVFTLTDTGLYRWSTEGWQRLELHVPTIEPVSITTTKDRLYVLLRLSSDVLLPQQMLGEQQLTWWIFRSSDLGNSWTDVTPTNALDLKWIPIYIDLIAAGDTLLAVEGSMVRSTDGGDTWMQPQTPGTTPSGSDAFASPAVNESILYVSGENGLCRSTDSGKTWQAVSINSKQQNQMGNIIAFRGSDQSKNTATVVYAKVGKEIIKTSDKGKYWNFVKMENPKTSRIAAERPFITQIVESGGVIYAKGGDSYGDGSGDSVGDGITRIYSVSADNDTLMRVQDMPIFDAKPLRYHLSGRRTNSFDSPEAENAFIERLQRSTAGARQFFKQLAKWDPEHPDFYIKLGFHGPFAVSGDTFYMEYNFKLFRWKPSDTEWYDTGQEETIELTLDIAMKDSKLAVSGNTVHYGKRDGHLVLSYDRGENWIDLTPALPFPVKTFKDIVYAGTIAYVATDAGVAASDDRENWRTITDGEGTNLIMEHLAVDGTTLYGTSEKTGVYRLDNISGTWKQIVSENPDHVNSLTVDGNILYVGTQNRGMLHYNLEE